jgi:hypothetical protein
MSFSQKIEIHVPPRLAQNDVATEDEPAVH